MKTPHIALATAVALTLAALAEPVSGQSDSWRQRFAAGEEARQEGDVEAYAREMAAAARAMPDDLLNRPFVQYHAARPPRCRADPTTLSIG